MSRSAALTASPWQWPDAVKAAGLIAIGTIVWAVGWYEVSERAAMNSQIAPMNLAIVGMLVIGSGQASWFVAGRRAVGRRRRALLSAGATTAPVVVGPATELVAGGERYFHRLDCAMLSDRGWTPTPREVQEAQGRIPCGVCAP